jgi:hypothetical protein
VRLAAITQDKAGTIGPSVAMDWDTGELIEGAFEFHVSPNTPLERVEMPDGRWAFIRTGVLHGGVRRKP